MTGLKSNSLRQEHMNMSIIAVSALSAGGVQRPSLCQLSMASQGGGAAGGAASCVTAIIRKPPSYSRPRACACMQEERPFCPVADRESILMPGLWEQTGAYRFAPLTKQETGCMCLSLAPWYRKQEKTVQ